MSEYRDAQLKHIAEALIRIAVALEDIAGAQAGVKDTPQPPPAAAAATPAYEAAVQALKDMPDDLPPEVPKGKPVTKEEVVAALNSYSRVHGVGPAKKVLQSYGETLGAVPVEKYGELLALLQVTK
jgi:hypothetical protein